MAVLRHFVVPVVYGVYGVYERCFISANQPNQG